MRKARLRAEIARLEAELDAARPYLGLAREIHEQVARLTEAPDGAPGGEALARAIDAIPLRERAAIARSAFDRLSPEAQWAIVERVYGDDELRSLLETERAVRVAHAASAAPRLELAAEVRTQGHLDTTHVPTGEVLTLGLCRESDVAQAAGQGPKSTTAARRVVLRATGDDGTFQVLEDVFNPAGGYFVTADYDEQTWRTEDRLPAHALVRVGFIAGGTAPGRFAPLLFLGARVDVEVDGSLRQGRLHLAFAVLGDVDLFAGTAAGERLVGFIDTVPEKRVP